MTVTLVARFVVPNAPVGMAEARRAKAMWTKAGAKAFRSYRFFTGPGINEWLFHVDFDDLTHMQKCHGIVVNSDDLKTINANNAKAGNKMVGREVLMELEPEIDDTFADELSDEAIDRAWPKWAAR